MISARSAARRALCAPSGGSERSERGGASNRCDQLGHCGRRAVVLRLPLCVERGTDEADEQRMTAARIRRELGMELAAEEPRVLRQLDHLAQIARSRAFRARTDHEAC